MDAIGLFLIIFAIFCGPFIYIYYRFLRTLRDLLRAVSEQNRGISPGLVWLNWIPVFSFAWMFVTIIKIRDSARQEFQTRGVKEDGGAGFGVGMTFAVASVLSEIGVPPSWIDNDDMMWGVVTLGGILGLVSLVCWILYWIKAAHLRDMLVNTVGARPFSAAAVTYQPASWQVAAPESAPASTPAATQSAPWLSQQPVNGQASTGSWLGSQAAAGGATLTCLSCGSSGQSAGWPCTSCGRLVSPATSVTQGSEAVAPTADMTSTSEVAPVSGVPVGGPAQSSDAAKCPYCGVVSHAGAGYCWSCGRRIQSAPSV